MEFRFENKITAMDYWKMSMWHMYHSMIGVCNIIVTAALIALTVRFWNSQVNLRAVFVFICIFFPVIQPVVMYRRAKQQVNALPKDMVMEINKGGIYVIVAQQKMHIPWNQVRGIMKEYGMIIIAVDAGRGYMLTDRALGTQKEAFLEFVETKVKR